MAWHESLSAGRWHDLSLAEQLGNVGAPAARDRARAREEFCRVF